ncbi:MAG: hypothetical protein V1909_06565, partial [Candidatus Micrarchaeota archaeon]
MPRKTPPQLRKTRKFCSVRRRGVGFALSEDVFLGDLTTEAVVRGDPVVFGKIVCQGVGVLAGVEEARWALGSKNCIVKLENGARIRRETVVFVVRSKASTVLSGVRTALNYLSRLSGLATNARRLSEKFGENRIAALRKTTPGIGVSEKVALQVGGVMAHRVNLGDGILIKKEHVSLIQKELGAPRPKAVFEATRRALEFVNKNNLRACGVFVEVEVESLAEAREAALAGPDVIMLDNVSPKQTGFFVASIKKMNPSVVIEASGGIIEKRVASYLRAGVDVVSG